MSESAIALGVAPQGETDRAAGGGVRKAVLAGPGAVTDLDEALRSGLFERLASSAAVQGALDKAGHVDLRRRLLPGDVTVKVVLGLGLFSGEGYDSVLATVMPALPGALPPGAAVPTGSALSQARDRVDPAVFQVLFELGAAGSSLDGQAALADWACEFGLEVNAFDGTTFDLANTEQMAEVFATPTGGRHPQARLVTLVVCGTRKVRAAAMGSYATGEQTLVDSLADQLRPGMLNLADRNFFSMARWVSFSATGAQLAWRVKNGAKSLPAKVVQTLTDGSHLVRLHESHGMLARRRREAGDYTLPRLADTIARLVEFDLYLTDGRGRTRRSRFRILTTLLDPIAYPAKLIATIYAERWQAELAYKRIKTTLRGTGVVLRGQTPNLAKQEIWAMLHIYNALCDLAVETAVSLGIDPDEISFKAVLRLTRTHLAAATACRCAATNATDPSQALQAAIAAHPRNRTDRDRTSPRTAKERRTERTRYVTYKIKIVESNLPKTA